MPAFLAMTGLCAPGDDGALRTREFVVMGYYGLRSDLEKGAGTYLDTLMALLGAPDEKRGKVADQVRELSRKHTNIMDFADQVLALRSAAAAPAEPSVPPPAGPNVISGPGLENALSHFTRGEPVTVYLRTGERLKGVFSEFNARRLWIRGAPRRWVGLDEIAAVQTEK